MAGIGRIIKLLTKEGRAEHLAQEEVEKSLQVSRNAKDGEQAADTEKRLASENTARANASVKVSEKLSELTMGRFGREHLDERISSLHQVVKESGLIENAISRKSPLSPLAIEKLLQQGGKVTPQELASLERDIVGRFETYTASQAKKSVENQRIASGEKTIGDRIKTWGVNTAITIGTIFGIGGAATYIDNKINNGNLISNGIPGNVASAWNYDAKARADAAQKEALTRAQQACKADAGTPGEVTGNCLKVNFGGNFTSLQEVFSNQLTREPDRVYLACLGKNLEIADANSPTTEAFAAAAQKARSQCISTLQDTKEFKTEKPDFAFVDSKVKMALGWQ